MSHLPVMVKESIASIEKALNEFPIEGLAIQMLQEWREEFGWLDDELTIHDLDVIEAQYES